jgi:hypothetical protein
MSYRDFLKGVINEEEAGVYTVKEIWKNPDNKLELEKILKDIIPPSFYHDISGLDGITFMQG